MCISVCTWLSVIERVLSAPHHPWEADIIADLSCRSLCLADDEVLIPASAHRFPPGDSRLRRGWTARRQKVEKKTIRITAFSESPHLSGCVRLHAQYLPCAKVAPCSNIASWVLPDLPSLFSASLFHFRLSPSLSLSAGRLTSRGSALKNLISRTLPGAASQGECQVNPRYRN